jgi:hypothetical protein
LSDVTVFRGGPILTMDPRHPHVDVVVVTDGRITAVGPHDVADAWPAATHIDLAGHTLTPGLIDAHHHLSVSALHPRWRDVADVQDPDELAAAVRAQAADEPDATWVRLRGWNDTSWPFTPTRDHLDAAGIDRPVVLVHDTLHQCLVSSAALDELGFGRDARGPDGGEIVRGPDGMPTGLLVERAWSEAHARSLQAYADPDRWADHIASHARSLWRWGITAVHDAACSPEAEAVYRRMAARDELPVGVLGLPHPAALLMNDHTARLDGPPTGDAAGQFRVGPMKLFADGGVAIALDTTVGGHPLQFGILMDDLEDCGIAAADHGFRLAVHAMGNAGVDHTIALFDTVRRRLGDGDHRFRIEHAGVTGHAQWQELAALDAIAVVQPGFVEHVGNQSGGVRFDDHHWLAFAGLADAGVRLAGSSDEPCAPTPPLWCAIRGVRRTTSTGIRFEPEQGVDLPTWLEAYTRGAAIAGGDEHERGVLASGLRADLAILDLSGDEPAVRETWIGGRPVYVSASD